MKVLLLNTFDEAGGAARSALRLHRGLRQQEVDSSVLVQFRTGREEGVICNDNPIVTAIRRLKLFLGLLPVRRYPKRPENNFSPAQLPDRVAQQVARLAPDIVHLHWLGAGFLRVETLRQLNKPIIWTLHDSWAFTGGCHVPYECRRFEQSCGNCPVLGSSSDTDLSRRTWDRKARAWQGLNMTIVAPSRWLAECARSSSLLRNCRVEVIPNGIETDVFQPHQKAAARHALGLPADRKIILFGAMHGAADPNKGFHYLVPALQHFGKNNPDALVLIFGTSEVEDMPELGMSKRFLGTVNDDHKLAKIYSAADLFVAPSLLENLPNTVMEAMACGVPCVAFDQGGLRDLIDHRETGYLARPYDVDDLVQGMEWVLNSDGPDADISIRTREKVVRNFSLESVARRYIELYREILANAEACNE
ncbi:MAG: glycosyltransferase family 4 protein [Desulfuromusa sp.]|nr:glycosyltransferase family 4 protein [Desulfuromusa sp.]